MFTSLEDDLERELSAVKAVASWNENLRLLIDGKTLPSGERLHPKSRNLLMPISPPMKVARVFDHYASISRTYALFEDSICKLITEYLSLLPKICPSYVDLPEELRNQHRVGTAHVLAKWGQEKSQYSTIAETNLVKGYHEGVSNKPYELLSDAFLTDTDNFRADVISRVFSKIGILNIFDAISISSQLESFCAEQLGTDTAQSYLNYIVSMRNEAAHGDIGAICNSTEISRIADFLLIIFKCITQCTRGSCIKWAISSGHAYCVGKMVKRYSNNIAGYKIETPHLFATGDTLYAGRSLLEPVTIAEIAVDKDHFHWQFMHTGELVGLKINVQLPQNSTLYQLRM